MLHPHSAAKCSASWAHLCQLGEARPDRFKHVTGNAGAWHHCRYHRWNQIVYIHSISIMIACIACWSFCSAWVLFIHILHVHICAVYTQYSYLTVSFLNNSDLAEVPFSATSGDSNIVSVQRNSEAGENVIATRDTCWDEVTVIVKCMFQCMPGML